MTDRYEDDIVGLRRELDDAAMTREPGGSRSISAPSHAEVPSVPTIWRVSVVLPAGHSLHPCRNDLLFREEKLVIEGGFVVPKSPWTKK